MEQYEIVIKGHLDDRRARAFEDLTLRRLEDGSTLLTGAVADQAALHAVLSLIRDLGLTLLRVERLEPGAHSTNS